MVEGAGPEEAGVDFAAKLEENGKQGARWRRLSGGRGVEMCVDVCLNITSCRRGVDRYDGKDVQILGRLRRVTQMATRKASLQRKQDISKKFCG